MAPGLSTCGTFGFVILAAVFSERLFDIITAALTFVTMLWVFNLAMSSAKGAYHLRESSKVDWNSLLEDLQNKDPTANDVLHIIIVPAYKESERMLLQSLENLGRSPMARGRTRIVLAMEAREGPPGKEKAERLIAASQHLFADVFATYHPADLRGEVAGKSSNTQWAYHQALRHIGPILMGCDLSRVFITVGDADTLWHPHYLSALTYQALQMSPEERSWTIWQPPVLLMRNIFTVPIMTQASSYATLIFELAGLANQHFFSAFAYSAYSMSLALASHPEVDGWDADVIAEDHHMFCKCYFAVLWELAHSALSKEAKNDQHPPVTTSDIRPQLVVQPIWLPAVSYLVESSDGYWASVWARFQQARRHSQGVVEIGYVLLQYAKLSQYIGYFTLPARTHLSILSIVMKMHLVHITLASQALAVMIGMYTRFGPMVANFVLSGGLMEFLSEQGASMLRHVTEQWGSLNLVQQGLGVAFGNISVNMIFYSASVAFVVIDLVEGRYYRPDVFLPRKEMTPVAEGDESTSQDTPRSSGDSEDEKGKSDNVISAFTLGPQTMCQKILIFASIFNSTATVAYPTILLYGVLPVFLASWSLLRRGTQFEYIVAAKPE